MIYENKSQFTPPHQYLTNSNTVYYKNIFIILIAWFLPCVVFAQNTSKKFTISGYMTDNQSTESLIGATVYNKVNLAGTSTNQYGFYSLTLPAGKVELAYSYVGYNTQTVSFQLHRDTVINISLEGSVHLQEVEITADRTSRIQETTQMSVVNLPVAQINSLPAFLGEADVLKVLQLMPGIQSGGEGSSGLYVRGGGPDQNLILLDGVPVYNVSHLFGFFSVFNADAINNVEIIKGGFPARYGGRVSSVLDMNMKEGNMQQFHGEGAVGVISAKLTFEGPIWKNRTSFIVTGRRTYLDALAARYFTKTDEQSDLGCYFYDLTAKFNHRFSEKDRIYLSAYMGDDKFHSFNKDEYQVQRGFTIPDSIKTRSDSGLKWGNITAAFRWNHIFTNKLFGNTALTYSRYQFNMWNEYEKIHKHQKYDYEIDAIKWLTDHDLYDIRYNSLIEDCSGKISFDYLPSPNHYIRFGANAIYHTFQPGVMTARDSMEKRDYGASKIYTWEYSAYAEDDVKLTVRLKTNIGLHWSAFNVDGKFYQEWQPRISARYLINPQLSAKAAYSRMAQYVHLLTNTNVGMPTDLWVPSTRLLRPQKSDQVAFGLAQTFKENYEITIEGYYKTMKNVLEYKEGAGFFDFDDSWENKILQGDGQSYGVELFAQKKTGSFTGWVGYTLSWSNRQFDELNNGLRFPYKYDRRHDLSIALTKRFGKKMKHELSGVWVFGSGNCVTMPIGIYPAGNPVLGDGSDRSFWSDWQSPGYFDYGERNSYRMKPYHRLDLSVAFVKQTKRIEHRLVVGVYNAYNRKNPFYLDVESREVYSAKQFKFVQYSLFSIIPSVSYHFKF